MQVWELIAALQRMPQCATVVIPDNKGRPAHNDEPRVDSDGDVVLDIDPKWIVHRLKVERGDRDRPRSA